MRKLLFSLLLLPLILPAQPSQMQRLSLEDLAAFRPADPNWQIAGAVQVDKDHSLDPEKGQGILVNQPNDAARGNLMTQMEHGDLDLSLEFMMAPHSNSGIYLMGRYEIQLYDSWGKARAGFADCGGVYQRWDESQPEGQQGYQGYAPRLNAARAPGLWQELRISFQAPRFDATGNKVQNARLLTVHLNGALIHQNIELTGPTRGPAFAGEAPQGPLLIQGDHGPVAFRNIRYQAYAPQQATVGELDYRVYLGEFQAMPDFSRLPPARSGQTRILTQEVSGESENFILTLEGTLNVPRDDRYQLSMNALGYGVLRIDGQEVMPMKMWTQDATLALSQGDHALEIFYYKDADRKSVV
jgi:hypothetical protein